MTEITSYPSIVPWRSKEEWLEVYAKLYSNQPDDLDWAVNRVSVWQARCPTSAPLGVETTTALVRARVHDQNNAGREIGNASQADVSMMYSMAIVRFVNLVCEIGRNPAHVTAIRNIAHRMGIPEWLVNIRHSATHKYSIPSLDMLRTGTSVAMQWLKLNYWEKEIDNLGDFVMTQGPESQMEITEDIRNSMRDFQQIHYDIIYVDQEKKIMKAKRVVLQDILNKLRSHLKTHPSLFTKVLAESGFLVSKYDHLEALLKHKSEFLQNESVQLPRTLEQFWAPVLNLFLVDDHLQSLLRHLLEPHSPADALADRIAIAWVAHILCIIAEGDIRIFQFRPNVNWLDLFKVALKKPTEYSPHVLKIISEHVPISKDVKQAIMALVAIFLGRVTSTVIPKKIEGFYTVDDIIKKLYPEKVMLDSTGPWKKCAGKSRLPLGSIIHNSFVLPEVNATDEERRSEENEDAKPESVTSETEMEELDVEPCESIEEEETMESSVTKETVSLLFL